MSETIVSAALWGQRADRIQASLDTYFGADGDQLLHNWHPLRPGDDDTFNYWWLAHALEARLDAFERTGDPRWRDAAVAVRDNILARNRGSLFNDYFDDMLWFGIALLRLHEATSERRYLDEAVKIWHHVRDEGWNDECGGGIAWRKQQLWYKNTPSNGTFVILGARLHRATWDTEYQDWARRSLDWLDKTLRGTDGFIEDGVNRENDGRVDTQWRFTYNQGLYIGACVELAAVSGDSTLLDRALVTARTAFRELSADGVLLDDGTGGDEGLFKGIMYRYAGLLVQADPSATDIRELILGAGQVLWTRALDGDALLAGTDWRTPPAADAHVPYSAQLSAIIGTEVCRRVAG
ncbi:glycoside hydrolase family 76 protein [Catenulispora rubra]|uniref:glycoside hydrolase family 76 protein n=1 Tax=Catenulispora rubra TaxID=280293 RepID=UPI0018923A67|nr:glycoside hydrolase family 76 protein [Catenulispora rubra]